MFYLHVLGYRQPSSVQPHLLHPVTVRLFGLNKSEREDQIMQEGTKEELLPVGPHFHFWFWFKHILYQIGQQYYSTI